MRAGWNPNLQAALQRGDSRAGLIAEVVEVAGSDVRDTRDEWALGVRTNVSIRNGGGVSLTPSSTTRVSYTTSTDPSNITRLTTSSPFDAILIEWYGSSARQRELRNFTARLHPRVDSGEAKEVAYWVCEVFRVTQIGDDDIRVEPLKRREMEAVGDVATDVTFVLAGFNDTHPWVGDPPEGSGTGRPMTVIRIVALTSDGEIAGNVAWEGSSTDGASDSDPGVYDLHHYTISDLPGTSGVTSWFIQDDRSDLPRFTLNEATYPDGDVEFTTTGDFDDLPGAGDLRVVLRGQTPSDSEIRAFIWNGAQYVRCYDGDIVGQDNRITIGGVGFGGDLSGVPTSGPWDMRVYLDASSDGLNTPMVRDFGLERLTRTPLIGAAEVSGGGQRVHDLVSLKCEIAAATVSIIKSGEKDYDDYGSRLLSRSHIGNIQVRLHFGDLTDSELHRSEWMLHSVWDVETYDSLSDRHQVRCLSPLRRLTKKIPPFVAVGGGPDGERTPITISADIAAAWSELADNYLAVPGSMLGTPPVDETTTIGKTIREADGLDELDAVAYLDGGANIESQGRIKFVRIMHDDPADEAVSFRLPIGSYDPIRIGTGFDVRTDEFFVPYDWSEDRREFLSERRHFNGVALGKLGGSGLNTTESLRGEVARWIRTEALADAAGRRVVKHFGTGELLWPVAPRERMPHLEIGDVGIIETDQFVARSPLTDRELRGPLAALCVVVGVDDAVASGLWVWVPSYELLTGGAAAVDRSEMPELDLSVVIPSTKLVPKPDTTQDGIYYIELQYNVGEDVDRLHIQLELDANGGAGLETADYRLTRAGDTWGTLVDAGRHRIGSVANPQQYLLTDTDVKVTVVPESADGITGTPVVLDIGRIDELGTGTSAALSAGGYAVSDYLVPGSNVTIDKDGNGRPRINATGGGGGASALDDLSDVTITSPADGEALFYDSGDWVNRDIAAGDVRSGVFGLARGGIGRSSVTAGNLIVGAGDGTSPMTELAPEAAGGFVRSNGSSWVRSAIQASDVPNLPASRITSGTFDDARIPTLNASKITAGTFDPALISQSSVTQHQGALALAASQVTSGTFADARIPSLAASKITSGTFGVARGGTGLSTLTGAGRLLVSTGATSLTTLDSGAVGGFVRSDGSTWTRATIQASDLPSHNHDAGDIATGSFGVSQGGTGRTSVTSGRLLTGAGTGALQELDFGAAGGFVRSNGSTWVRSTIQAGDLPSHTHSALDVTSDVFNIARIPSIPVSGLTPGTLANGSWVWRGADGSAAAPSRSFNSDTNTGDYRVGENIIGIATAGVQRGQWDTTGLKLVSGSAAAPSLANIGFTNYGMYWASGVVGLSVAGTSRIRATTSGAAVTGTITATGDVQSSVSDARLKTELRPIDRALDRVGRLHGVTHRYTDEALDRWPELTASRRAALIAQDVADVLPEAVVPFAGDDAYLNYLPDMVIPLLVEAIKELRGEVEALRMGRAA